MNNSKIKYDVIINLDTNKISFNELTLPEKLIKTSKYEKNLFTSIYNKLKDNFKEENENWMVNMNLCELDFEGSDDYIRNEFKNYFNNFLINFSLAYHTISNNNTNNKKLNFEIVAGDKNNQNSDDEKETKNYLSDDNYASSNEKELSNHLLILEKIINTNLKILKKTLKSILEKAPKIEFLCAWIETVNFKLWFNQVDKNLFLRSEYVKHSENLTIFYENGDIFTGNLSFGQKHGFGVITEANGFVYNGHWLRDMVIFKIMKKDGYGTLSSNDNKYIYDGEWKDNKKNGQGQLINDKTKYSGYFKK